MYKHSYRPEGPWQGEFDLPQQALDAGRAIYGDVTRVYVGKLEPAYFSDMFIGAKALLSYMKEEAEAHGDLFVSSFDNLPSPFVPSLQVYIEAAIGEWEADLPELSQFQGEIVKHAKGYTEAAMVRHADFSGT